MDNAEFIDILRIVLTVSTGFGTMVMAILLREVILDFQAARALRDRPDVAAAIGVAQGEVMDQCIRIVAVGALFIAGLSSMIDGSSIAAVMIIISALAQVWLATVKLQRRRKIFRDIRQTHRPSRRVRNHAPPE